MNGGARTPRHARLREYSLGKARLAETRIAILGLGLMGGSLALALRGAPGPGVSHLPASSKCALLIGIEKNPETLALARQRGLADLLSSDPAELLPQADFIILATPVRAILSLLEALPSLHPGPAVVLDLGSTKSEITAAMRRLPARFDPIGGHPMCGKERSSLELADALLYQDAPFALAPLPQTTSPAKALVEELVREIGARPFWVEAETHDRWVAATSHLPYLLANTLAAVTPAEAAPLAGPGYRSTSRLAVSPVDLMVDVLATNRLPVLAALRRFQAQLELIEGCLESGDEQLLHERLAKAAHKQEEFLGANSAPASALT